MTQPKTLLVAFQDACHVLRHTRKEHVVLFLEHAELAVVPYLPSDKREWRIHLSATLAWTLTNQEDQTVAKKARGDHAQAAVASFLRSLACLFEVENEAAVKDAIAAVETSIV